MPIIKGEKMPHDIKGRKIDLGDVIVTRPYNQGKGDDRRYAGVGGKMDDQVTILSEAMDDLIGDISQHFSLNRIEVREVVVEWARRRIEIFSLERVETRKELMEDDGYITHCKRQMAHEFSEALWENCSESKHWKVPFKRAPNFRPDDSLNMPYCMKMSVQMFVFKRVPK